MEIKKQELEGEKGLRYNTGKIRYDLLEPFAIEQLAKVFTKGSEKYAPHNWLKGMEWSKIIASLERHYQSFKKGEDFDTETGMYHMAQVAWNALAIVSYYKYHPELDDRQHDYLKPKRIGLDVDDVLADWTTEWSKLHNIPKPTAWQFDRAILDKFDKMNYDGNTEAFYLSLPALIDPKDIPFEPACYVTSRPIPNEITEQWLDEKGFPAAPVYSVGMGKSKVDALREAKVDIFVDDRWENFIELNRAGICCFLFDQDHNRRYDAGYRRLYSLKDLI